jgi:hypothetical protein
MCDIPDGQRVITSSSLTRHLDEDTGSLTVTIRINCTKLIINATNFTLSVRSVVRARHIDHFSGHDVTEWDPWRVELATE